VLAGRRPDCGRHRARTRGRRNKSKVWTRKTHDALRAAGFRAAQLRDRLEWVDAQRRSGREHGEEARQRSHRKGTSRGHYCSYELPAGGGILKNRRRNPPGLF
jgi:hypothetical protein